MSEETATHFLNVDLNVHAKSAVKELIDAFAPRLFELGRESPDYASFEVDGTGGLSVDETISAFYEAVQALPPSARAIWEGAERRSFDIGILAGHHPRQARYSVSEENVARLSEMRADIVITVYAPDKE